MFYAPSWGTKRGQPIPSEPAIATDLRQLPCFFFSGWAVLAAGALVASIFAVGAAPAAAQNPIDDTDSAAVSAFSDATSCLGPALDDADFSDVAMGTAHYNAVNCIAHYGITAGRGDGSFGARDSVTRSQMALFLSGMSALAGVTLADAMDAGFTDLGDTAADRVNAINRLVNGGIMTGSGDDTFSPEAAVTRAEMALWLVNFMVRATNASSPYNVHPSMTGYEITPQDAAGPITPDHFPDARQTQPAHVDSAISVAFELGITAGYGDNEFKGHRAVTRAEMATFITRTLAHTNVRPSGLTAQHTVTGSGANREAGIQVSLRDANFAPVANEPIDLFRSYYPDSAFRSDRTCEPRYVQFVRPSLSACEIDRGDTTTEADGNREYTATMLDAEGEGTVTCGTTANPIRFAEATVSPTAFWVWTGALEDTVDADTELVRVEGVPDADRMGGQHPHHANVSGGLNSTTNQREARMGTNVRFNLQLQADPADNSGRSDVSTAPDSSGNKYNLAIEVRELSGPGGDDFTAATRSAVRVALDSAVDSTLTDTYDLGSDVISRTLSVVSPDASGMIPIDVTYPDPDRARDNPDVVVIVQLTAFNASGDTTAADYNRVVAFDNDALNMSSTAVQRDDPDSPGTLQDDPDFPITSYTAGFETRVIFSDARPNPAMFDISADTAVYRLAGGLRPVSSHVDITALDQYGNPVRGLSVNAVSNQNGETNEGTSRFPFVQYFTTGSSGTYRVQYTYTGNEVIETLTAFAAIANERFDSDRDGDLDEDDTGMRLPDRDTSGDREQALESPALGGTETFWALLLPGDDEAAKPTAKVYWADIGRESTSRSDGYTYDADATDADEAGDLLAWDVADKAFVVFQPLIVTTIPNPLAGPYVYYWDSHDTFQVTDITSATASVSMELFETIISATRRTTNAVTLGTLTWNSYDYNRPNDRAQWTISCVTTPKRLVGLRSAS